MRVGAEHILRHFRVVEIDERARTNRGAVTSCPSRRPQCPGAAELVLSGQLGDVMKESARKPVSTLCEVLALALEARERAIAA